MTKIFAAVVIALFAIVLGQAVGWKFVFAPLLGMAFFRWALASLRSMASGGTPAAVERDNTPRPASTNRERTLYWCEECGTELLLVMRGSGVIPRHCMEKMHERTEVIGGGPAPIGDATDPDDDRIPATPRRERDA